MMRCAFVMFFSMLFLASCKPNRVPSGILKPEKMQQVLWDIIRADVFTENFIGKDSTKNKTAENIRLQNKIFLLDTVTREAYYKSYEYYKANPGLMNALMDSISQSVIRNRDKIIPPQAVAK